MRHRKHRHQLGLKKEHREALMTALASAIIEHGRITTTLAKAKALRPFIEPLVTMAKDAKLSGDATKSLHWRRIVIARLKGNVDATNKLFDELAGQFSERKGGYTRIYKIGARIGDAAEMALIEFVGADDKGYAKRPAAKAEAAAPAAE